MRFCILYELLVKFSYKSSHVKDGRKRFPFSDPFNVQTQPLVTGSFHSNDKSFLFRQSANLT